MKTVGSPLRSFRNSAFESRVGSPPNGMHDKLIHNKKRYKEP